jgi:hypothetical protein
VLTELYSYGLATPDDYDSAFKICRLPYAGLRYADIAITIHVENGD